MPIESPLPSHLNPKECYTCKKLLPASAYWKSDTTKYYRCKECERNRLREYRKKVKHQDEIPTIYGDITCHACREAIPFNQVVKTGLFKYSVCKPCHNKIRQHKKPHKAELVNGRGPCTRCELYGKSDKCIRPHKVDLDESE